MYIDIPQEYSESSVFKLVEMQSDQYLYQKGNVSSRLLNQVCFPEHESSSYMYIA